jgi:hypothetical protein
MITTYALDMPSHWETLIIHMLILPHQYFPHKSNGEADLKCWNKDEGFDDRSSTPTPIQHNASVRNLVSICASSATSTAQLTTHLDHVSHFSCIPEDPTTLMKIETLREFSHNNTGEQAKV